MKQTTRWILFFLFWILLNFLVFLQGNYDDDLIPKNIQTDIKDNKIMLLEEDIECVHKYLDDLHVPRKDESGNAYSIVGRIKVLQLK